MDPLVLCHCGVLSRIINISYLPTLKVQGAETAGYRQKGKRYFALSSWKCTENLPVNYICGGAISEKF